MESTVPEEPESQRKRQKNTKTQMPLDKGKCSNAVVTTGTASILFSNRDTKARSQVCAVLRMVQAADNASIY